MNHFQSSRLETESGADLENTVLHASQRTLSQTVFSYTRIVTRAPSSRRWIVSMNRTTRVL